MITRRHDTLLPVADLINRPGASRRVDLALPAPEGLDLPLASVAEPVRLTGEVASVVEGLLVRGMLRAEARVQCARCLDEVETHIATDVAELFSDPQRTDHLGRDVVGEDVIEEGYEVTDGMIDLDTLLRDALVPAIPYQPLCDAACRGLCPVCGVNRNEIECACDEPTIDARWAALEALRLKGDGV